MNLLTTIAGSLLEGFFPSGWDLAKIDACCSHPPSTVAQRQTWWNAEFTPIVCETISDFEVMFGHAIAKVVAEDLQEHRPSALILPVGPMGMYKWAVYFLREWNVKCNHVYGFNMDEWSDEHGKTLPADHPGAFQHAMETAFYGPLGDLTVPKAQRWFATHERLPRYAEKIKELKSSGARLTVVFGIGRVFHIAFWEPHFAGEYESLESWKAQTHRLGAKLHPLTIEQNAITSFKGRTTLVPAFANTIGPGLFLQADQVLGGADGAFGRGMQWQGPSVWTTLRHEPDPWIPSSYMPTLPGKLFILREILGPLTPDLN